MAKPQARIDARSVKKTAKQLRKLSKALKRPLSVNLLAKKTTSRKGYAGSVSNKGFGARNKAERKEVKDIRRERGFDRDASDNADLWAKALRGGRDPLFMDRSQAKKVLVALEGGLAEDVERMSRGLASLKEQLMTAGRLFVKAIKSNINRSRSENGRMRPNKPRYAKNKRIMFGKSTKPLVRTGQLRRSLYPEVDDG
jgi:hypothetical protein